MYTEEMQILSSQSVDDFDEELVLNLDENADTNFAVFGEDTILVTETSGVNVLVDNGDGTYTVTNADSTFTGLSVGDVFAYTYADGTVLVVKVGAVSVKGTTVTITEDTDIELTDVFDYLKIESTGEEEITVDHSTLDDGVTFLEEDDSPSVAAIEVEESKSKNLQYEIKDSFESTYDGATITGSYDLLLKLGIEGKLKLYIGLSYSYIETSVTATANISGDVTAAFSAQKTLSKVNIMILEGVNIGFTPVIKLEAEGEVSANAEFTTSVGFSWTSSSGFTNTSYAPKMSDCSLNVESTIYVGFVLDPYVSIGLEVCGISLTAADVSLSAEMGVQLKATMGWSATDTSYQHDCNVCVAGEIYLKGTVSATVNLLKWSKSATLLSQNKKWKDFYYSFTYGDYGWTTCPHLSYLVTVTAKDANGNLLAEATIGGTGLEEDPVTDEEGVATFYLPNGDYTLSVTSGNLYGEGDVTVEDEAVTVTLETEPETLGSGTSGNITWKLDEYGTLTISGSGTMNNYSSGGAPWYEYRASIFKIVVESGVTSIGNYAFAECKYVAAVTLAEGITSIGNYAFYNCAGLYEVSFPQTLGTLGSYAFRNCSSLESVTFTYYDKVYYLSIGEYAFADCTSLTDISLSENVTSIGNYAFSGCSSLRELVLPESISDLSLGYYMISGTLITSITVPEMVTSCNKYYVNSTSDNYGPFAGANYLTSVIFESGMESIPAYVCAGCTHLTSVSIPNSVLSIGTCAFLNCTKLTGVILSDNLVTIGSYAFRNCDSLTEIVIPESTRTISSYAFYDCDGLTDITIRDGLTTINEYAFYDCDELLEVSFPKTLETLGNNAFQSCDKLWNVEFSYYDKIYYLSIGNYAFADCTCLTDISLSKNVTSIGNYTFSGCSSLKELLLPESISDLSLGYYMISGTLITSITVPKMVTS
ncbi:MAG: leucine-rich repeat protein, partial [Lachnospiraceae bacterium]|nr:leucine-rich repeat protein [Lachnospiraceae bacterium]